MRTRKLSRIGLIKLKSIVVICLLNVFVLGGFVSDRIACAEVFTLKNGSVVTGECLNEGDKNSDRWIIRTVGDVEIEVAKGSVKSILAPTPPIKTYAKSAGKLEDKVASHRKVVDWCIRQGLTLIADAHRERVVELDPSDKSSWAGLGYIETSDGWIRKEVYWKRKGMQSKGGHWRFPQDIAVEEKEQAAKIQRVEVTKKLDQSIRDIRANNNKAAAGRQYLDQLSDPIAIPKLREIMVADRGNSDPGFRLEIINILNRMHHSAAIQTLVDAAVSDPSSVVADHCIELLSQFGTELAISSFMGRLSNLNPYKDDPDVINRAARALSRMGDERCIPKLIECLVTKHMRSPPPQPQTQAATTSDGAVNFSPRANTKAVERHFTNQEVLAALQTITGENGIQYDKDAWLHWYAEHFAPSRSDVLRDP